MAQAASDVTTFRRIPLSRLFADPALRAAFRAAEDSGLDTSITFAIPPDPPRSLAGGAAAAIDLECEEIA